MRWTTSAQSSRLKAVVASVTESWTWTVCDPAERLPLVRTTACWYSSPDVLGRKVSSTLWFGEDLPPSLLSKTASAPAAGLSSVPSTVIFSRHFSSAVPPKQALSPEKKTTSLSVSPLGTVTACVALLRFVYDVDVVEVALLFVCESTSAT